VSASLRYVAAWNSAFLPSKDLTEGITAMFAKRAPEFKGEEPGTTGWSASPCETG